MRYLTVTSGLSVVSKLLYKISNINNNIIIIYVPANHPDPNTESLTESLVKAKISVLTITHCRLCNSVLLVNKINNNMYKTIHATNAERFIWLLQNNNNSVIPSTNQ